MKLTAPAGKIIVKLDEPETVLANGIIIPDTVNQDPSTEATVVSSGYPDVSSGDRVLLSGKYAGAGFEVDGAEFVTVVPDEILGVLG